MRYIFHVIVLFYLWKSRNNISIGREEAFVSFSLSDKYVIFYDTWLQIIAQVEKVNLEVQHLWNMLDYWDNAPCATSRLPPDWPP